MHGPNELFAYRRRLQRLLAAMFIVVALTSCSAGSSDGDRYSGAYLTAKGEVFVVTVMPDSRLRLFVPGSGFSRRLEPEHGGRFLVSGEASPKGPVNIEFDNPIGNWTNADQTLTPFRQITLAEKTYTLSTRDGIVLRVKVVAPGTPGPHPVIVLAHGSGDESAVDHWHHPVELAAYGYAAVVYDKRGTGRSSGGKTHSFSVLASDMNEVIDSVRRLPEVDVGKIVLAGYSQGGWVAPLAASTRRDIRAVVVHYGLLVSPLEEERSQLINQLSNVPDEELNAALEFINAGTELVATEFNGDWPSFKELCARTRNLAWRKRLDSETLEKMCTYPAWLVRWLGPGRVPQGLDYRYDPVPTLRKLGIPTLWLLAANDAEAPPEKTIAELERLRAEGLPIELQVFPRADHGMWTFVVDDNGERRYSDMHGEYFAAFDSWLRQTLQR